MRTVKLIAMLAVMALLVAACGDEQADDTDGATDGDDAAVSASDGEGGAGADLDDDVAAVVDGDEIVLDDVEAQVESFAGNPEVAEALEGPEGDQTLDLLRAQVVSTMIINKLAIDGADDLDRPVTDDDVAQARAELEEETGGAENLTDALEQEGMSEDQLAVQLRALAALRNIEAALAEGDDAADDADPEALAQQYVQDRLRTADIVVNDAIGTWDPQTGRITPPGGVPAQPAPPPTPE